MRCVFDGFGADTSSCVSPPISPPQLSTASTGFIVSHQDQYMACKRLTSQMHSDQDAWFRSFSANEHETFRVDMEKLGLGQLVRWAADAGLVSSVLPCLRFALMSLAIWPRFGLIQYPKVHTCLRYGHVYHGSCMLELAGPSDRYMLM